MIKNNKEAYALKKINAYTSFYLMDAKKRKELYFQMFCGIIGHKNFNK